MVPGCRWRYQHEMWCLSVVSNGRWLGDCFLPRAGCCVPSKGGPKPGVGPMPGVGPLPDDARCWLLGLLLLLMMTDSWDPLGSLAAWTCLTGSCHAWPQLWLGWEGEHMTLDMAEGGHDCWCDDLGSCAGKPHPFGQDHPACVLFAGTGLWECDHGVETLERSGTELTGR